MPIRSGSMEKKSFAKSSLRSQMLTSFLTQSKVSADPFMLSPNTRDLSSDEYVYSRSADK